MRLFIELNEDEIRENLDYALICTTRESSIWDTSKRRRLWKEQFTEQERSAATNIFFLAHKWYLKTGVPDDIKMSLKTLALWKKLACFCCEL